MNSSLPHLDKKGNRSVKLLKILANVFIFTDDKKNYLSYYKSRKLF